MKSVSELLMESVLSAQTRMVLREALKDESFSYKYDLLVRSGDLSSLSNEHVDRLVLSIMASQRLIDGALSTSAQPNISNDGFVRSMNNSTRLVLDRLVARKSRNRSAQAIHCTLSTKAINQWHKITFYNRVRSTNQRLATLAASDSALSLIEESGRDVNTLSNAELCALAQANRAVHRSVSDISLPPVPADACITVLDLEGDTLYWTADNDVVGVDINDPSTFHHEEIVGEGEIFGDSRAASAASSSDRESSGSILSFYKQELRTSNARSDGQEYSAGELMAGSKCGGRKRSLLQTNADGNIKRRRSVDTSVSSRDLKRRLDCATVDEGETSSKYMRLEEGLVWTQVVNGLLLVHVSTDCTVEHYTCLSKRLGGNGSVSPTNGLLLSIRLPLDKPQMCDRMVEFFSPQKPWCREAYCLAGKHKLSMIDALTENMIRSIVREQRHDNHEYSSDCSSESQ